MKVSVVSRSGREDSVRASLPAPSSGNFGICRRPSTPRVRPPDQSSTAPLSLSLLDLSSNLSTSAAAQPVW